MTLRAKRMYINHGFTLIELLVTVALIAIIAALGAPSLREFAVKGQMRNINNDFSASVLRARNEAVGKNTCVTMCMSSTIDDALPSCKTTDQDWQVGWIVFLNPACDSSLNTPPAIENVVLAKRAVDGEYYLNNPANRRKLFFNSLGYSDLSVADKFDLIYKNSTDPITVKYGSSICIDKLGRTRTIPTSGTC